jgi:hypothetical protein
MALADAMYMPTSQVPPVLVLVALVPTPVALAVLLSERLRELELGSKTLLHWKEFTLSL